MSRAQDFVDEVMAPFVAPLQAAMLHTLLYGCGVYYEVPGGQIQDPCPGCGRALDSVRAPG